MGGFDGGGLVFPAGGLLVFAAGGLLAVLVCGVCEPRDNPNKA